MFIRFFESFYSLFIDMSPYLILGLLFVGLLHIMFSKSFIIKHIGKDNFMSVVKSSFIGVPLPLCSCGVVPTAVFMSKNGASKGAVISFLISTPQTGIDSIAATYGLLGWVFAIYRPLVAFVMGITGGLIVNIFSSKDSNISQDLEKFDKDHHNHDDEHNHGHSHEHTDTNSCDSCSHDHGDEKPNSKIKQMFSYAFIEFLDDISLDFIVGLLVSALIGAFLPEDFFSAYNIGSGLPAMLLMIVIGIPMYICATTSIPIAVVMMMKGLSPGAAFVFLAVGPATNAASLSILFKTIGRKTVFIYLAVISIMALLSGYFLDYIFDITELNPLDMIKTGEASELLGYFSNVLAFIFLILISSSIYRKYFKKKNNFIINEKYK